jgi:hypothetical protein
MLRALGPRAQSARLLTSHCVTCMSSPSQQRSIDDTIDTFLVGTPLSTQEVNRAITAVPVETVGRSTQTRARETKFESAASCVMRSERIRQEVQVQSKVWQVVIDYTAIAKILTRCQNIELWREAPKVHSPQKVNAVRSTSACKTSLISDACLRLVEWV